MSRIDCLIPEHAGRLAFEKLSSDSLVGKVAVMETPLTCSEGVAALARFAEAEFVLIYIGKEHLSFVDRCLERMLRVADDTGAVMIYSDRFLSKGGEVVPAPVIDCQKGALRDDFDFGGLVLIRTSALREAVTCSGTDYSAAAFYDLRLRLSRIGRLEHVPEFLYYEVETDSRKSGEKQFDYVDPRNRASQIEMEHAVTEHLKAIGA